MVREKIVQCESRFAKRRAESAAISKKGMARRGRQRNPSEVPQRTSTNCSMKQARENPIQRTALSGPKSRFDLALSCRFLFRTIGDSIFQQRLDKQIARCPQNSLPSASNAASLFRPHSAILYSRRRHGYRLGTQRMRSPAQLLWSQLSESRHDSLGRMHLDVSRES